MTVPSQHGGPCSASAAPLITPMIRSSDCAAASSTASSQRSPSWLRSVVYSAARSCRNGVADTVFAVIAAQLGEKRDRLLGALRDQLAEQPVSAWANAAALALHVGREQVAHRDVDGEPVGVEPADQFVADARASG